MSDEHSIMVDGAGPRFLGGVRCVGIGAVYINAEGELVETRKERIISAYSTNNLAEFLAIELGLKMALDHDDGKCNWIIYTDSTYARECWYNPSWVKKPHLQDIAARWRELAAKLGWRVAVRWISREENVLADKASKEGIMLENNFPDMAQ